MKRLQQGFTLIELMIVVAIVGILAAIALPAYQDYVIRSKMSELEAAIAACKTSVAEFTATHAGTLPANNDLAGCSDTQTKYVTAGATFNGVAISGTSQNTGASPAECTLTLTPTQGTGADTATITTWTGTYSGCAPKYVPSTFR